MFRKTVITILVTLTPMTHACEWNGIREVRGSRSLNQTIAMCKLIPACLEKYELNEQCKKDWYEQRRIGQSSPRKKRPPIPEYEEFTKRMESLEMPYNKR